jgi:hypothetical protein
LEGIEIEEVGIFYGHLVHFRTFDLFYGRLAYFVVIWYIFPVLVCCTRKIWQPCFQGTKLLPREGDKNGKHFRREKVSKV